MEITQDFLKNEFVYNPDTGVFVRRHTKGGKLPGSFCGTVNSISGYVLIKINRKPYLAHRLAFIYMNGAAPFQVDHINHIRSDNSWINLRSADAVENGRNRSLSKNNKSGVNGVHICKKSGLWMARLKRHKVGVYLGKFENIEDAKNAINKSKVDLGFHINHGNI